MANFDPNRPPGGFSYPQNLNSYYPQDLPQDLQDIPRTPTTVYVDAFQGGYPQQQGQGYHGQAQYRQDLQAPGPYSPADHVQASYSYAPTALLPTPVAQHPGVPPPSFAAAPGVYVYAQTQTQGYAGGVPVAYAVPQTAPAGLPSTYALPLPPPPPGPPPAISWDNHMQGSVMPALQPGLVKQAAGLYPGYQIDPHYALPPSQQQYPNSPSVDTFSAAAPTHAAPAGKSGLFGGLVKGVVSVSKQAVEAVRQDYSAAQGRNNAAPSSFQGGVGLSQPVPPLPQRHSSLQQDAPMQQDLSYIAPHILQGQQQVLLPQPQPQPNSPVQVAVGPYAVTTREAVALTPPQPVVVVVDQSAEQQQQQQQPAAPKQEIKRKAIGAQVRAMGTGAVHFVKSDKGASLLSGAASALNLIASAADPHDPQTASLKLLNTAVQSQAQKSKAKQEPREAADESGAALSEETPGSSTNTTSTAAEPASREVEKTTTENPLARLTPEQLSLIIAMAAHLQQQQQVAVEHANVVVADPGDPDVPDLSTLSVQEDPPETSIEYLQPTPRDTAAPTVVVVPTSGPMTASTRESEEAAEEQEAEGPSNLQRAGNVGKAYVNIATKANTNPLGTSMAMWSEVGRQFNKYRAKQASGEGVPRTAGEKASAFGKALMKSIERVGAPAEGQDNSLASLAQRYQESQAVKVGNLERALAGDYKYLKTGNGWREENAYALGANGRFSFSIGSSCVAYSIDQRASAYAYDRRNPTGTWKAQGDVNSGTLILTHDDGSVEHRSYEHVGGKFFVNGLRWFSV
ncbi:uncharacterized protein B0I36DRAFT_397769 [Microdochium trichocladiopsis]|uniref:Uncharacterized protein n=1 Tax=Microdochium trichocladiopsis TaxID=1682393 RepID=A0A9P8XRW5_9PEZI|nr:uncharacterized protein B0I36DRAFT_397769 [Microdochium trichocladiopsis]KAH7014272.1 hypothetical protein B0I36DRAFT_397769 [Microdochium trichocladiopsis]